MLRCGQVALMTPWHHCWISGTQNFLKIFYVITQNWHPSRSNVGDAKVSPTQRLVLAPWRGGSCGCKRRLEMNEGRLGHGNVATATVLLKWWSLWSPRHESLACLSMVSMWTPPQPRAPRGIVAGWGNLELPTMVAASWQPTQTRPSSSGGSQRAHTQIFTLAI